MKNKLKNKRNFAAGQSGNAAAVRGFQSGQDSQKGRFAPAGRAGQANDSVIRQIMRKV